MLSLVLFSVIYYVFCYLIFTRLKSKSAGASKKSAKAAKDPNKPKRPASAFFVFMYISLSFSLKLILFFIDFQIRVIMDFLLVRFLC